MGQKIETKRIALIVEDNAELRTLAATLLEKAAFEVVEVGNGEEACTICITTQRKSRSSLPTCDCHTS
jgi:CheY-like chemotaxis protein